MNKWITLSSRRLISVEGKDSILFLQGLVTQNLLQKGPWFTALLTPQGRFHSDFFIIPFQDQLFIDCDKKHMDALWHFLGKLKVLHDVRIQDASKQYASCVALGPQVHQLLQINDTIRHGPDGEIFYKDPRTSIMGVRALIPYEHIGKLPHALLMPCDESSYHYYRLQHVIAEGAYDLLSEKSIILEYGYHNINAICWMKGCYVGQELMAQIFHKGEIRKNLYGLCSIKDPLPPVGTELFHEKKKIGRMGSHCKDLGLASLYVSYACMFALHEAFTLQWGENRYLLVYIFQPEKWAVA